LAYVGKKFSKDDEKNNPAAKEYSGQLAKYIEDSDLKQVWDEDEYDKEYR
jgi:hypothetical protein